MKKNVIYEVKSLENAISRYIFSNAKESKHISPPSPMQGMIMRYLIENQNKEVYQRELEDVFKVRKASISGVLQTMEKRNIIKKVPSKKDGRTNKIILTDTAVRKNEEMAKTFVDLENKLTKNISEEDLKTFYKVMHQMRTNIEAEN